MPIVGDIFFSVHCLGGRLLDSLGGSTRGVSRIVELSVPGFKGLEYHMSDPVTLWRQRRLSAGYSGADALRTLPQYEIHARQFPKRSFVP